MATEKWDIVSALIRRLSNCNWSHVGFYRLSDGMTYSAMADGKGLAWRPVSRHQTILLLDHPNVDAMFRKALEWEGTPYNFKGILGMLVGKNWTDPDHLICDQTVFRAAEEVGTPLVNPRFIPRIHLTPRDILLSPDIQILSR